MGQKFKNNAYSSLNGGISDSALSLTVATGQGANFPSLGGSDWFYATLADIDAEGAEDTWEIIKVTERSTDVFTIVRAQDNTTALSWLTGTRIELRMVAADADRLAAMDDAAKDDQTGAEIKALYEGEANAFTDTKNTKLSGIETGATADQSASEIRTLVGSATDSNVFTDADHSKLDGIEASATADQSAAEIMSAVLTVDGSGTGLDADLLDGTHLATIVSNYESYADNAVSVAIGAAPTALNTLDELAASLGDDPDFAGSVVTSLAGKQNLDATLTALAGTVITANVLPYGNGADSFATTSFTTYGRSVVGLADASAARTLFGLVIGTNVQAYSATLANTTASFTTAQESKLSGIESGATADQTDAEIRAAVEAASDSNVFTDADHSKLNAIEASADVTDTTNVTAAGALMDSEVDANLKTFALPASTTISTFGASTVAQANATAFRSLLGIGTGNSVTFNSVTDALGKLRQIPSPDAAKTGAYSLDADDVGTVVPFGTGGLPTIPNSVLVEDDVITLVNETSGDITITCTIATAYVGGVDVATATLSAYGFCTILFRSGTVCHISGDVS